MSLEPTGAKLRNTTFGRSPQRHY